MLFYLQNESKWSKCFYTYMLTLCSGAMGQVESAVTLMKTVPGLVKKKTNQIEAFVSRRAQVIIIMYLFIIYLKPNFLIFT